MRPHESTAVFQALLKAHAELVAEADGLAAGILDKTSWESVGEDVEQRLRSLPLEALNDRAGYQRGRGYVHECDAAAEVVQEALEPYLDDIARRLALGMTAPAHQVAAGVLAGLHACDGEHGSDGLLGYAGDMDNYAHAVLMLLDRHRAPLPDDLLAATCPAWSFLQPR